jgi:hypothetical protein
LETRFLHSPEKSVGFVGCALSSTIFAFYKDNEEWVTKKVFLLIYYYLQHHHHHHHHNMKYIIANWG